MSPVPDVSTRAHSAQRLADQLRGARVSERHVSCIGWLGGDTIAYAATFRFSRMILG